MDGDEIRRRREARGLTQQALAKAMGVSYRTVGAWERGETVPQNRMGRLREFFGTDATNADDPIKAVPDTVLLTELLRRAVERERFQSSAAG